jgi:hypothetical protein
MKKAVYLFCTKLWLYLTEIPAIALLVFAICYNDTSKEPMGLYPLIIASAAAAVFIFVYLFRFISIDNDEIRYHGIFTSRDKDFIKAERTLVVTLKPFNNMKLELYGDAGEIPPFDWMKPEDVQYRDVCYFTGRAIGGKNAARRIASYFTVPNGELEGILTHGYTFENETVKVTTEKKNEVTELRIYFKITIM